MTTKTCTKCKEIKPLTAFNKKASKPDGLNLECRTCVSAYRKNRYDTRKRQGLPPETYKWEHANRDKLNELRTAKRREIRDFIRRLKSKPCADCMNFYPATCMDWDHRKPDDKDFNISEAIKNLLTEEKILAEISKCDLVCSNCHRIRSAIRRGDDPQEYRMLQSILAPINEGKIPEWL